MLYNIIVQDAIVSLDELYLQRLTLSVPEAALIHANY